MKSYTVFLMSCKLPSVRVIGSNNILVALDFFLDPPFSYSLGHLMRADFTCGSVSCCSIFSSVSSSILGEGDLVPLSEPCYVPPICFFICSEESRSTWALSAASIFLFSASYIILSLASSFLRYAADLLSPTAKSALVRHLAS